ncbi:hypothetical protein HOC80_01345 [archaeon]|jgi:hypothetical protein|nr:hypothetical protein [archaeon]MBT4416726.1 hypothetical protein [archaeon]
MGIITEFNPDLALRNISHYHSGERLSQECIPETLVEGEVYPFIKSGQRNYWMEGEIALLETEGGGRLSDPLASIVILEATHYVEDGKVCTRGIYCVEKVGAKFNWMKVE